MSYDKRKQDILVFTRRKFLLSSILGLSVPAYGHFIEAEWLQTVVQPVRLPKISPGRAIRVLQVSDFHISPYVPYELVESAIELGLKKKPDLICVTGDFITNDHPFEMERYAKSLRRLSSAAPTFACLGNHDGGSWSATIGGFEDTRTVRTLLAKSNITLLHNRSQVVEVRGQRIQLVGVGDLWENEIDEKLAFREVDSRLPVVLLAHNPDSKDVLAAAPWDLMLSGHTHGGQVLVPVVGERFVPVKDKRFIAGLKAWQGRQVYVTRGVGNLGGIRVNCRPEVTILDLANPSA
jgi:uncharacterized protein